MKLNFKMSELIYSETAIKNNVNNMPDINSLDNLLNLIYYCLQPARELLGAPMIITSGYRNPLVNRLVGGVNSSQHTKGHGLPGYLTIHSGADPISAGSYCGNKNALPYDPLH